MNRTYYIVKIVDIFYLDNMTRDRIPRSTGHESDSDNENPPNFNKITENIVDIDEAYEIGQRYKLEYNFSYVIDKLNVIFDKFTVVDCTDYKFRYSFTHDNGRFITIVYGKNIVKVTHTFSFKQRSHTFPTSLMSELILDARDLLIYRYQATNNYDVQSRLRLYNKLSKYFFKCIYIHGDNIMADINSIE